MDSFFSKTILCIVIYEKKIEFCETFISLTQLLPKVIGLDIVIYDNSKVADLEFNSTIEQYKNTTFHYVHNEKNPGLGVAYNFTADLAINLGKEYLVFFDQDTIIPESYFLTIYNSLKDNQEINLFAPIIVSKGITISPSLFKYGRSWINEARQTGKLSTHYHTIINSGVVIRLKEFVKLGGYEILLPLDYSDHYFFYKYKQQNNHFFVMPITLNHELSTFFDTEYNKVFNRFKTYIDASKFFAFNTKHKIAFFWGILHAVKLSIIHKRVSFLKYAFSLL